MARHRRMEVEDDASTKMDISSLIDCCFLLLLYFIVATSIVQERKLDMAMPSNTPASKPPDQPLEQGLVEIDETGQVFWGQANADRMVIDSDVNNHELDNLVTELEAFRDRAESVNSKPMVQFRVQGEVPMQRVIDVLNAFTKAGIKDVGLVNVADD